MKIYPVGAELFHADGQTDRQKLLVAFRNVANAPTNGVKSRLKKAVLLIKYSILRIYYELSVTKLSTVKLRQTSRK
jgi:hypothetical protein